MAATNISTATAADTRSPEEVLRDVQHLIALRPPTDPVTGMMVYDTRQAAEYREALLDIVASYGTMKDFQETARLPDPAVVSGPQPALADSPGPPGFTAVPPATSPPAVSLARFASDMMAPGPLPGAAGAAQNAGPPAVIPRRGTGTVR